MKALKITALILAIALILGVCLFANSLLGNPISKALAESAAEKHVAENYKDTDYKITELSYSFKDGYYHATVSSESSIDTTFDLLINGLGKVKYDDYDYTVKSGWSTANRLMADYRKVVEGLLASNTFPYNESFGYGELLFVSEEQKNDPHTAEYAMITNELTLDAYYNVNELGKKAGRITVYINDNNVSAERMAEMLLGIRKCFDEAGVGFYAIDCVLEYPNTEGGAYEYGTIEVAEFLYSDIHEEGLVERVTEANEKAQSYYGLTKDDFIE